MKAWRKEAAAINARKAAGSKEPSARVQMQQARYVQRMFKPKGSGNWLLDGLLIHAGFKAAVYGDPVQSKAGKVFPVYDEEAESLRLRQRNKSWLMALVDKTKAWWNS